MHFNKLILFVLLLLFAQVVPAQKFESSVTIKITEGKFGVSGVVSRSQQADEIKLKIKEHLGNNVSVKLVVDNSAEKFEYAWRSEFEKLLLEIKTWKSGLVRFYGRNFRSKPLIPEALMKSEIVLVNESKTVTLNGFKGKVVILTFIASWSGPCRDQARELNEYLKANPDSNIKIFALATDAAEIENGYFRDFAMKIKYIYPFGWAVENMYKFAAELTDLNGIPITLFTKNGEILAVFLGVQSSFTPTIREVLDKYSK